MPIHFEREGDARVTKLFGNQPRRHALAEGEDGKGVAQIVKPDIRQTGARDERFESALDEVPPATNPAEPVLPAPV